MTAHLLLKLSAILAAGLLLSSCLSVNEEMTLHADGSGVVKLSYRVARLVLDLPASTGGMRPLPLPSNPESLASAVRSDPALTLESFSPVDTATAVGADATIAFSSLEGLNRLLGKASGVSFELTQGSQGSTFRETIYPGTPGGVDPQTLDLVKGLFGDERLDFALTAPSAVQSVNRGSVGSKGATASYSTTVPQVIADQKPVVWEVRW